MPESFAAIMKEVRACQACAADLPQEPRPVLQAHPQARILIIGQAPGRRVQESGIPWDDPSGNRLREWLGMDKATFYDAKQVALVPMGFCYPGTGPSGDLPPRKECCQLWHHRLLPRLPKVKLTLLLSQYALAFGLGERRKKTLTETVRCWRDYLPEHLPLPHPSPRNNRWLKNNPWFVEDVIPYLQRRIAELTKR